MMKPVIFSGTTEGKRFSEKLSALHLPHIVCVATGYGEHVMEQDKYADVRSGRLTERQIYQLIRAEADIVFDATHPYAVEVSENIHAACTEADIEYVRITRSEDSELFDEDAEIHVFDDAVSCAEALKETAGNILLTTGSKEIGIYTAEESIQERLFARVLPSCESIDQCEKAGLKGKQIIAMQGPFGREMDLALIRQFDIHVLVTKSSGLAGGVPDKIRAAKEAGIPVYMIRRPDRKTGLSVGEALEKYFSSKRRIHIDLIGTGPGDQRLLTAQTQGLIRRADIICGAGRMIREYGENRAYPFYRAEEIIPVLEEKNPERVAVLFSGDTGFYSGCRLLEQKLRAWADDKERDLDLKVHPGISSFAYLASRTGISYQDARFESLHGCSDDARAVAGVIRTVRETGKTFILLSGAQDVRLLGTELRDHGLGHVKVIVGWQLSYPEETIRTLTCSQCRQIEDAGLYTALVINEKCRPKAVVPVLSDDEMLRGDVPMTKESIRHLSVLKLGLTEGAVVYDIGSGTGSVACEIAKMDPQGQVYAIDMKEEACSLIRQNADRFRLPNVRVIHGKAPDALRELEKADGAFVGGSSGNLKEILEFLNRKSPGIRVVINAVSLETMAEVGALIKRMRTSNLTVEQVSVARMREAGDYHLMKAENPVMIAAFNLEGDSV